MRPHNHACYYCQIVVETDCDCPRPARAVICDSCSIIYEPVSEEDDSGTAS